MAEFKTEITADTTPFTAAHQAMVDKYITDTQRMQSNFRESFSKMGDSVKETFNKMNSSFDGFVEGMSKIRGAFAVVAGIVAGGALFGKMISDTAKATGEVVKLSKMLGITTEEASTLHTALGMIGGNTDDYASIVAKMTMKLRDNEERFNELGVATRNSNGELLSGEQIMQNSLKAMLDYKEGTDRNLMSTELLGKGWAAAQVYLKKTPELMEAAKKKGEELETVIGPEGAARLLQYNRAMNDVKEVFAAIANRIGQALMPILTEMGEWFAAIGPAAVVVMRGAIGMLAAAFWALKLTVEIIWGFIKTAIESIVIGFLSWAEVANKAIRLDFAGAKAAWQAGARQMVDNFGEAMKKIMEQAGEVDKKIKALFDPSAEQGASAGGTKGGKSYTGKPKAAAAGPAEKSQMAGWEAELAAERDAYDKQKIEQGSFQQYTLAMERDFWKKILDTVAMTDDERAAASKKYYAAELQLRKQAFEAEIADIHLRIAQHKAGSAERIQLAGEAAAKIGQKYGLESKEYKAAVGEMSKMAEERYKQQQKLEEMAFERTKESKVAVIELERQALDDAEKLGLINADQKLARLKQLKELEYNIELQALSDMAAIYDLDAVAYQQHLDKLAKLKEKHAADMAKIDGQMALESKKNLDSWIDPIGNAFQNLSAGILQHTQTLRQGISKALMGIAGDYLGTAIKIGLNWVKQEILKTEATTAGIAARGAAETVGSTESILVSAGTTLKIIAMKAWEAAASVYASIAAIPYVGPFLAPVMALAAAGVVLGFAKSVTSAEGGFDVPPGLSPVTQLHPEEMVLPAGIANAVRAMAGAGNGANAGAAGPAPESRIRGMPPDQYFMVHRGDMVKALRAAHRDFTFTRF